VVRAEDAGPILVGMSGPPILTMYQASSERVELDAVTHDEVSVDGVSGESHAVSVLLQPLCDGEERLGSNGSCTSVVSPAKISV